MRILIIGAGLGGLCLAQGLRASGIDVAVFERDDSIASRAQGYRVSVDPRGMGALRECLPPDLYELFEATRAQPSTGLSWYVSDGATLNEVGTDRFPEEGTPGLAQRGWAVDRLTLREILLAGLEGAVHFGSELTGYDLDGDTVRARFAGGATATGDVLVAADGVGSRVRQQALPHVAAVDTGMRWLGGRTPLDAALRDRLPEALADRAAAIRDGNRGLFLADVRFAETPRRVARRLHPEVQLTEDHDYLMWSLLGRRDQLVRPDDVLNAAPPEELHRLAVEAMAGGHPVLREAVEKAEPDRSFHLVVRTVPPPAPWPSTRVTLLGDAIHAGQINGTGANTALQDAALLRRTLLQGPLLEAVARYESAMLANASAMRKSLDASAKRAAGLFTGA